MKNTLIAIAVASSFSLTANADNHESSNDWQEGAMDAWIDGKAEATLLFNGNLDSFDINTDVENGVVTLTGKVDSDLDRKLAEELVIGIDGVTDVDNKLSVVSKQDNEESSDLSARLTDTKIATVVKSRLLFDTDIAGTKIDVDVEDGTVTLTGEVESDAERDLAVQIAQNASDVRDVEANLSIVADSE